MTELMAHQSRPAEDQPAGSHHRGLGIWRSQADETVTPEARQTDATPQAALDRRRAACLRHGRHPDVDKPLVTDDDRVLDDAEAHRANGARHPRAHERLAAGDVLKLSSAVIA